MPVVLMMFSIRIYLLLSILVRSPIFMRLNF